VPQLSSLDGSQPLALLDEDGTRFRVMTLPENPEPRRIRLTAQAQIIHSDIDAELEGLELILHSSHVPRPTSLALLEAYPNPFNPSSVIGFQLPVVSEVRLDVLDMMGRQVVLLVNGQVEAGSHTIPFDGRNLASGVYMVRMRTATEQRVIKLTLLK
jgi:hypothetical protein